MANNATSPLTVSRPIEKIFKAKVYGVDPLRSEHPGGSMKIIAFVIQAREISQATAKRWTRLATNPVRAHHQAYRLGHCPHSICRVGLNPMGFLEFATRNTQQLSITLPKEMVCGPFWRVIAQSIIGSLSTLAPCSLLWPFRHYAVQIIRRGPARILPRYYYALSAVMFFVTEPIRGHGLL